MSREAQCPNPATNHSEHIKSVYNEFEKFADVGNQQKSMEYKMQRHTSGPSVSISIHEAYPFVKIALLRTYFDK